MEKAAKTRPDIAAAFVVLGLGAWITVNGVYQELPIIAESAPEGYDIFSYVVVMLAVANAVPFAYLWIRSTSISRSQRQRRLNTPPFARGCGGPVYSFPVESGGADGGREQQQQQQQWRHRSTRGGVTATSSSSSSAHDSAAASTAAYWDRVDDVAVFAALACVGVLDCVFLALFWRVTTRYPWQQQQQHTGDDGGDDDDDGGDDDDGSASARVSVGLLLGTLVGGFVDCLTSLLYYPFAGKFPPEYTPYLLAGEALTGLLASMLATVQAVVPPGAGFSVAAYFSALACVMLSAACAFAYLRWRCLPQLQRQLQRQSERFEDAKEDDEHLLGTGDGNGGGGGEGGGVAVVNNPVVAFSSFESTEEEEKVDNSSRRRSHDRGACGGASSIDGGGGGGGGGSSGGEGEEEAVDDEGAHYCEPSALSTLFAQWGSPPSLSSSSSSSSAAAASSPSSLPASLSRCPRLVGESVARWVSTCWAVRTHDGQLFACQVILSFLENGLLVTLAPRALSSFESSELLLSVALKLSSAGATLVSGLAYRLQPPPLLSAHALCSPAPPPPPKLPPPLPACANERKEERKEHEASLLGHSEALLAQPPCPTGVTSSSPPSLPPSLRHSDQGSSGGDGDEGGRHLRGRRKRKPNPQPPVVVVVSARAALVWASLVVVAAATAAWMVAASRVSAGDGASCGLDDGDDDGNDDGSSSSCISGTAAGVGAVAAVVCCKMSLSFMKTSLFVAYHPQNRQEEAKETTPTIPDSAPRGAPRDNSGLSTLRWGGFGIQVGGLVGAVVFFLLTVTLRVL